MKTIWTLLVAATLPLLGFCSDTVQIVEFGDVTTEMLTALQQGEVKDAAIHIPAHTQIPFDLQVKGDVVNIDRADERQMITFPEDIYVWFDGQTFRFSRDGLTWQRFCEFISGEVDAHLLIDEEGPCFKVELEMFHTQ